MALFKTRSAAVYGIDAHLIDVEVDMYTSGNRRAIHDGRHARLRGAREPRAHQIARSSIPASAIPTRRVTINLAPANVRKEGAGFDLPMAIGILGAMGASKASISISSWANSRSMARSGPCAAPSRLPSARANTASPT